ncbi:SepM family pheromone-processing serine protease [Cytobacillus kochii]|uniref:SepM family pheromone-processing serine protease n=1 Tax=Cytobacillus kochii TaxID=859143 RepID=UPI001CD713F9|nr:SepM family pheromone-processing serine protease [Cytobacillus kochii]MCA1027666.1 PDZ domain-containing protein [Cytobacillus kochii]MCM3321825.1 PDZ domain-containing protein [Cytobacillus kochii]MCM3343341.1 PDZ domain-containing protein [Cytobacillus kochii]MDM5207171.1 SepM family pheromone-processing serine protease [Cytobacillus kochii]
MKRKIWARSFFVLALLVLVTSFIQLPYYVSKPGMAKELEPIIEVENGDSATGSFMLTTIRMGKANIYTYLWAKWQKYQHIYPIEDIRRDDETDREYQLRQLYLMDNSKQSAIEVAYQHAGLDVNYNYQGVYVLNIMEGMPAEGKLEASDMVTKVDGKSFQSSEQFIDMVSSKSEGDSISLTFERNGEQRETDIELEKIAATGKAGVGITLVDDKEISVDPEVAIDTSEIGGPSAGFMFSLEIYNQLVEGDLTKGYEIAGTGTISPDGTVGRIGGIDQKIVAADNAGADIFFAPNENNSNKSNYKEAVKTAKDIDTDMKIIPIDTFDDAVKYLEGLENKS